MGAPDRPTVGAHPAHLFAQPDIDRNYFSEADYAALYKPAPNSAKQDDVYM